MESLIAQHLFDFTESVGVIGGLLFTAHSLRSDAKMRRTANLLAINNSYREIWREFLGNPALARVLDASADTSGRPASVSERVFVGMVLFHAESVLSAIGQGLLADLDGLRRDVAGFVALPVPQEVWRSIRVFQNADFVAFIESCADSEMSA